MPLEKVDVTKLNHIESLRHYQNLASLHEEGSREFMTHVATIGAIEYEIKELVAQAHKEYVAAGAHPGCEPDLFKKLLAIGFSRDDIKKMVKKSPAINRHPDLDEDHLPVE